MLKNQKGFSLIQVMIAAALVGGLAMVIMQLNKNIVQSQILAESKADEIELRSSIRMILNNEKYCRLSLAGNGALGSPLNPVTFRKSQEDEDDEGIDISLYLSNQVGDRRSLKKFNGANNPGTKDMSKFGKLKIQSIKLIMNNPDGSGNLNWDYANSLSHDDTGILRISLDKQVSSSKTRQMQMDFDINVYMTTGPPLESNQETRVLSCSKVNNSVNSNIQIIESASGYDGQTGNDACSSLGKTCVSVHSHNFPVDDPSDTGTHGVRVCSSWYNQALAGVADGNDLNNVHNCSARIGQYTTYLHVGVLRCNGHFYAICN